MKIYTKESLISELIKIREMGWIQSVSNKNSGAIGNTLEYLLGIQENNLPIPNAAEWELKSQKTKTTSLITLFHLEPSPRTLNLVPQLLLQNYGWKHKEAGKKYPLTEKSFRQTINAVSRTNRGFGIQVDHINQKLIVSFDAQTVASEHQKWLESVEQSIGMGELNPQPYWGFNDLFYKAGTKLTNCFLVTADQKREKGNIYFHYQKIYMLQNLSIEKFINAIENGNILVDFDARTGHNHGTKFRIRQGIITQLYEKTTEF